jgi:hypothetical protein
MYLLRLVSDTPAGESLIDTRRIDIRPFQELVGAHSVRMPSSYDPTPFVNSVPGWKRLPEELPPSEREGQAKPKTITVLVHGFAVGQQEALTSYLPTLAKRLYWAGTPVLEAQGKAYVTGLLWPGDQQGALLPTPKAFYPENEFNAFRSGIPVALWLDDLADGSADRKVNIVAHSLGNIVMNNAFREFGGQPRSPITYVMLEAAVAAEAFDGATTPHVPELLAHAQAYSYADDARWRQQELDMNANQSCPPCFLRDWQRKLTSIGPNVIPPVKYGARWSRPAPGERTAWEGFFASNKDIPNLTMLNVYSPTDYVVRADLGREDFFNPHPWFTCQRYQKPSTGLADTIDDYFGRTPDGWRDTLGVQFWGTLGSVTRAQDLAANEYLWASGNHAGLIRQWAELAFWFPAVSGGAGAQPLASLSADRNISMGSYSGSGYESEPSRDNSHSFFWVKPPADVWGVYKKFGEILPR